MKTVRETRGQRVNTGKFSLSGKGSLLMEIKRDVSKHQDII